MVYRKANKNDVVQLTELRIKQLLEEAGDHQKVRVDEDSKKLVNVNYNSNELHQELVNYFASSIADDSLAVWIAVDNDRIIATCGVCFFQYPPTLTNVTGKIAYITDVYTEVEYRSQGIATKLLEFVMKEINERQFKMIRLHTSIQGRGLYEKIGFTDIDGFMVKRIG